MKRFLPPASLAIPIILAAIAACGPARSRPATEAQPAVTSEDVERTNQPIEVLLQRRTSGVTVTRVGDGIAVLIRGATGYDDKDRSPLYILNGSAYTPGPGGALTGIDPYEIESIRVLKGGDAALYGIDGANGVIVITTKRAGTRKP